MNAHPMINCSRLDGTEWDHNRITSCICPVLVPGSGCKYKGSPAPLGDRPDNGSLEAGLSCVLASPGKPPTRPQVSVAGSEDRTTALAGSATRRRPYQILWKYDGLALRSHRPTAFSNAPGGSAPLGSFQGRQSRGPTANILSGNETAGSQMQQKAWSKTNYVSSGRRAYGH